MSLNEYLKCPGVDAAISAAVQLGAASAVFIAADSIVIEDALASLCREPRCENFGLSASCPPHVPGPTKFRQWLKASKGAIFRLGSGDFQASGTGKPEFYSALYGLVLIASGLPPSPADAATGGGKDSVRRVK